jgi:hypothetical protein
MRFPNAIRTRFAGVLVVLMMLILTACTSDRMTSPGPDPLTTATKVEVSYCAATQPSWVAFQDGDGAWTRALPTRIGNTITFSHEFTATRAAVATVIESSNGVTELSIQYSLPAELPTVGDTTQARCGRGTSKILLGTVAGLGTNEFATISSGFGVRAFVDGEASSQTFTLRRLLDGPQEVLATRTAEVDGVAALTSMILRRTGELPDGSTLDLLDFNSAEAFAPAVARVRVDGIGPDPATTSTQLRTPHGTSGISRLTVPTLDATRVFFAVPEASLAPTDLQVVTATAISPSANVIRSASLFFRTPVDLPLTLGPPASVPTLSTVATTPSLRLRARFDTQAAYDRLTSISYVQELSFVIGVSMTAAYAALTATGYDLVLPDLSSAAGFDPRWTLQPNDGVFWTADRIGGTLGLGANAVPTVGATTRNALAFDAFLP